jgi:hypothetical protein
MSPTKGMSSPIIFKYRLQISDHQTINLPAGARVLKVDKQSDELFVWALVDSSPSHYEWWEVVIIGTGNHIHQNLEGFTFVNTVVMSTFVWHVFMKHPDRPMEIPAT